MAAEPASVVDHEAQVKRFKPEQVWRGTNSNDLRRYIYEWFTHRRVSTNDGYLEPSRGLGNLSIFGHATAERVVVRGGRAVGVEILHGGRRRVEYGDEI